MSLSNRRGRDHVVDLRRLITHCYRPSQIKKISGDIISSSDIQLHDITPNTIMPGDETRQYLSDESDSEVEEEEEIPHIEVDITKLTALSPEVISKQVRSLRIFCELGMIVD